MNAGSIILRTIAAIALLAYPALVYFGMSSGSPRQVSLILLLVMVPALLLRLRKSSRQAVRGLAAVPMTIMAILGLAALLDASDYILATPIAANAVLLIAFGGTLRRGNTGPSVMPMIERFARLRSGGGGVLQQPQHALRMRAIEHGRASVREADDEGRHLQTDQGR